MTDFDKQHDEMQLSWEKTKKEMERQQEMFLESWKKTSEEMDRQQLRMLADWKEMSKDAERQFSKMIEECKKTYGTIAFDYKFPSLDSCTKECITQQLVMLRDYYAVLDKDLRKRYRSIQGKKGHAYELKDLVSAVKTIDKLYYRVNDMIKDLQKESKPIQRKLESKNK
ncbi:unknown [Clostridium sp. CAG:524]|nr:unknown [Clostridium sp. CAG:524]